MSADLKPYPAMKDSGVPWLGEIPEHWALDRIKRSTIGCKNGVWGDEAKEDDNDIPCVRVADFDRQRLRVELSDPTIRNVTQDERTGLVLRRGDLLLEKSGGGELQPVGCVVLYDDDRPAVCSNFVARMLIAPGMTSSFWRYFHAAAYAVRLNTRSIKQTTGIQNLDQQQYFDERAVFPPSDEQIQIATFLDHADRRIRRYIRAKQQLIALLEEQKQAFIHQTVTGQIDVRTGKPYPAYKDSRVESLGRIPQRWRAVSLGRLTLARCDGPFGSGLKSSHYTDEGIRVVRLQNIGHGTFNDDDAVYIAPEHYATLGDHSVQPGDLLIAGLGDPHHPAGRACVAPTNIRPAMVKADCFRFRLDQEAFLPAFAALQLTATARAASAVLSTGATRQRTNLRSTTRRYVVLPSNSEQARVVESCTAETARLNAVQQVAGREILLMGAYRTRLIADVVTGKLDVREVAAGLPDVDSLAAHDPLDGGNATHDVSDSESEVATTGRDESENSCADERSGPDGHEVRA